MSQPGESGLWFFSSQGQYCTITPLHFYPPSPFYISFKHFLINKCITALCITPERTLRFIPTYFMFVSRLFHNVFLSTYFHPGWFVKHHVLPRPSSVKLTEMSSHLNKNIKQVWRDAKTPFTDDIKALYPKHFILKMSLTVAQMLWYTVQGVPKRVSSYIGVFRVCIYNPN